MKRPGRRSAVLGVLLLCGGSIAAAAYQAPGGGRQGRGGDGAQVIQVDKLKDNLFVLRGGGGNTAVFVGSRRRHRRRYQDSRMGPAAHREDQGIDRQAGDPDHQQPHPLRPCRRQRRLSHHHRHRRPREHLDQHEEGAAAEGRRSPGAARRVQGEQREEHGQADVHGQDDDRQRRRSHRPVLLRTRPHERRRLDGLSRPCA